MNKKPPQFFQLRADAEFWACLDKLVSIQGEKVTNTQMVKRLVKYAASKKLRLHENVIEKED
jgi:hypothetical protein